MPTTRTHNCLTFVLVGFRLDTEDGDDHDDDDDGGRGEGDEKPLLPVEGRLAVGVSAVGTVAQVVQLQVLLGRRGDLKRGPRLHITLSVCLLFGAARPTVAAST